MGTTDGTGDADAPRDEPERRSRRLESLGRLTTGVAHDFNSRLAVIAANAESIIASSDADAAHGYAVEILATVQQAAGLTRRLLASATAAPRAPSPVDVNGVVRDTVAMLSRVLGANVTLSVELGEGLGAVVADPGQIEQIVLNLLLNARDAIDGVGSIHVRTSALELACERRGSHGVIPRGRWVMLAVSDSGVGMDDGTLARVFEPRFTTKAAGTGVGLSTVDEIARACGGHVDVRTARGVGTTFAVHLPSANGADASSPRRAARPPAAGGVERVLLVDDDDAVRAILATVLRESGYSIVEARTPDAAVAACIAAREPFDLVLTDVVLPGMSCSEMIARMRSLRPELRVLRMSGCPERVEELIADGEVLLEKPFSVDALLRATRDALDRVE